MDKVYTRAFCNLSATWAVNSSMGLFSERKPSALGPIKLQLGLNKEPFSEVNDMLDPTPSVVGVNFSGILSDAENIWGTEVLFTRLHRRGWVLQERLLAPRILHFCPQELMWECCEATASETFPEGLPPGRTGPASSATGRFWIRRPCPRTRRQKPSRRKMPPT